jgi:hypothetical protein
MTDRRLEAARSIVADLIRELQNAHGVLSRAASMNETARYAGTPLWWHKVNSAVGPVKALVAEVYREAQT